MAERKTWLAHDNSLELRMEESAHRCSHTWKLPVLALLCLFWYLDLQWSKRLSSYLPNPQPCFLIPPGINLITLWFCDLWNYLFPSFLVPTGWQSKKESWGWPDIRRTIHSAHRNILTWYWLELSSWWDEQLHPCFKMLCLHIRDVFEGGEDQKLELLQLIIS